MRCLDGPASSNLFDIIIVELTLRCGYRNLLGWTPADDCTPWRQSSDSWSKQLICYHLMYDVTARNLQGPSPHSPRPGYKSVCLSVDCLSRLFAYNEQSYHIIVSVNSLPKARRFRNLQDYLTQRTQYRDTTTAMFLDYCHKLAVEGFM